MCAYLVHTLEIIYVGNGPVHNGIYFRMFLRPKAAQNGRTIQAANPACPEKTNQTLIRHLTIVIKIYRINLLLQRSGTDDSALINP